MKGCEYLRTAQKYDSIDDKWKDIEFKELQKGDLFRLFDDEIPVIGVDGFTLFGALGNAYINAEGIWTVNIVSNVKEE